MNKALIIVSVVIGIILGVLLIISTFKVQIRCIGNRRLVLLDAYVLAFRLFKMTVCYDGMLFLSLNGKKHDKSSKKADKSRKNRTKVRRILLKMLYIDDSNIEVGFAENAGVDGEITLRTSLRAMTKAIFNSCN